MRKAISTSLVILSAMMILFACKPQKQQNEPTKVTSLSVMPTKVSLRAGEKQKLVVKVIPENASVTFKSNNTDIATVSKDGEISAISEGKTFISISSGDKTTQSEVIVTADKPVTYLTLIDDFLVPPLTAFGYTSIDMIISYCQQNNLPAPVLFKESDQLKVYYVETGNKQVPYWMYAFPIDGDSIGQLDEAYILMPDTEQKYNDDNGGTPALYDLLEKNGFEILQRLDCENLKNLYAYNAEKKIRLIVGPMIFDKLDGFPLMFNYSYSETKPSFL